MAAAVIAAIAVAAQGGVAAGEKPVTVQVDDSPFLLNFGVSPKTLPPTEPQSVKLGVSTDLGSPQSALKELQLWLDRDIRIDASDIPSCGGGGFGRETLRDIEKLCRESIVGRGYTKMTITFPDQAPISVASDVVIFNGEGEAGPLTFYVMAHITVPTPALIVITLKARKNARGRYGTLVKMDVPVIAGGYAIVDELNLVFGRRAAGGERHGVATATCTRGSLEAEAVASFRDGSSSRGVLIRPCVGKTDPPAHR